MIVGTCDDDEILITPEEAESLLAEGKTVHNFLPAGNILLGCDYDRAEAVKALKTADRVELAGPNMKGMKHPICVWHKEGERHRVSFFEGDMAKVEAFEKARAGETKED